MEKQSYQLFKSAHGDINNANGTFYYDDFDNEMGGMYNASGDIMNAGGLIDCDPTMPYPPERIGMLRDAVSTANYEWSYAKADKEAKLKAWQECKSRFFCVAISAERALDAAEALQSAKLTILKGAQTDLAQAEKANKEADAEYDQCYAREQIRLANEAAAEQAASELEAKKAAELAAIDVEMAEVDVEKKKVGVAQLESGKQYALYGAMAIGVIAVSFFGFKIITN